MNKACSFAAGLFLCGAVVTFTPGCPAKEDPKAPTAISPTAPEAVYTVRAKIAGLPAADKPGSSLQLQHEPIDNFVRQDGTLGMDSMTMPFPLAKGVSLDGFTVGDIVEVTFEVRWKSQPRFQTTRLVKLPADTVLRIGKARGG